MNKQLVNFIRWILFIPGAFFCSCIISIFIKAFPEVLKSMDLGFVALSVFIANLINSCIWGASFSISGLWIAPKRNAVVNTVLSTIFAVVCLFYCWSSWYTIDGGGLYMSIVIFNTFALFGCIIGGAYYISENKRTEDEEKRYREAVENNETSKEEHDKRIKKEKERWEELIQKRISFIERYREFKEKE